MDKILQEGDLEFDFSRAIAVWEYEREIGDKMSHCMKCVEFVVEWDDAIWLIEVKDPENPNIPKQYSKKQFQNFMDKLQSDKLFSEELGPKAKDTFLFLYLQNELGEKPLKYLVLLGLDSFKDADIFPLNTPLKRAICFLGPDNSNWVNYYFEAAHVFNIRNWNKHFPYCQIRRINT